MRNTKTSCQWHRSFFPTATIIYFWTRIHACIKRYLCFRFSFGISRPYVDSTCNGRRSVQYRRSSFQYLNLLNIFHRYQIPSRTTGIYSHHRHFVHHNHHAAAHTGTKSATATHLWLVVNNHQTAYLVKSIV